tara:strand:- start:1514 stop:2587 length:1074 start_codon:yes stop_codon:yes gene_type:complete
MNILTDILSLFRRKKFVKAALPNDVIVLGLNEEPDMTGVASPIPYKSVRLIKVKDFKIAAEHCDHVNVPTVPGANTGAVYQKTAVDKETEKCTVSFRTLKSLSTNLTIGPSSDNDYVEFTTTGEPNTAANVGSGKGVWKDKVGETLNFKSLVEGSGITIAESLNEITITSTGGGGITSVTNSISAGSTTPLTGSIAGSVLTLTSNVYGGGTKVGYVPSGSAGESKVFLDGTGTWREPSYTVLPSVAYNEYAALVSQTGTGDPTLIVLESGISVGGTTVVIAGTYTNVGTCTFTFTPNIPDADKVVIAVTETQKNAPCLFNVINVTTSGFQIIQHFGSEVTQSNGLLFKTPLLIKLYN